MLLLEIDVYLKGGFYLLDLPNMECDQPVLLASQASKAGLSHSTFLIHTHTNKLKGTC